MASLRAAAPALIALALLAGCGGHGDSPIRTASPVTALALDGKRLAWTDCHRIHVVDGRQETRLSLPARLFENYCQPGDTWPNARLALAGTNVGWLFEWDNLHASYYGFVLGATSVRSASTHVLAENSNYGYKAEAEARGSLTADGRTLFWTWPRIDMLGPPAHDCDIYGAGAGCRIKVSQARVHGWSRSGTRILTNIPPAGPIAVADGWVAVGVIRTGTFPQSRSVAPRSVVVARRRTGAVVARVRGSWRGLAVSRDVLAVAHERGIAVYRLPSGRLIRVVVPPGPPAEPLGGFTLSGNELIFWKGDSIKAVDALSGRARVLASAAGAITAVAADRGRLAWATEDPHGRGVIREREL